MKKKVALLGDSIRLLGYGTKVPEVLGDSYEVYQPQDNCRFVKYMLRGIYDYKNQLETCDIIHWNNGLWDACDLFGDGLFTSLSEYTENILRVGRLLKKFTPHVIFATTTPVRDDYPDNKNSDIEIYNNTVVPSLKAEGIQINDLYATVYPRRNEFIRDDDKIHLTELGIDVCSKQVADAIRKIQL